MNILELGQYVVPAYAGMILAEQGHSVEKWTHDGDPILSLNRGAELWAWLNAGKRIRPQSPGLVRGEWGTVFGAKLHWPAIVLDNFRPAALARWGIDPAAIASKYGIIWVSMRDEMGGRSFDLIAQARSWMEYGDWVPFWAGDTTGGLWLAFKALAVREPGHYVLGQASCMQKLVEGELLESLAHSGRRDGIPWEVDPYRYDPAMGGAVVQYRGEIAVEPIRDRAWKLANLWHDSGRIRI
jgi:hypothetical protein